MKQSAIAGPRRPPRPGPSSSPFDADAAVACPHCGASEHWSSLAPVGHLDGDALAIHLAVPPDGWFVDIRACARCGLPFARKLSTARLQGG